LFIWNFLRLVSFPLNHLSNLASNWAKIVLEGQEVLPKATQAIGFDYRYPNLEAALEEIVPKM